jgi:hypothetical protein
MSDVEPRVAALEARVENAFALDSRLKSLEGELGKLKKSSSLRDWLGTLGPYIGGLIALFITYVIKDSVTFALQREQLDLEYVKQMRDLIKDFDEADGAATANADAVGLAMFGKHAIIPLVERLEAGDVIKLASERGLRLVGSNDPAAACPKFAAVINDKSRRYKWQTHQTMIKVIGQSACVETRPVLARYREELEKLNTDTAIAAFARRYSVAADFDIESIKGLKTELDTCLDILSLQVES